MTTNAPAVLIHRQWQQIKAKYPDAILLFKIGDFYEAFEQDAEIVASTLDVVLASRKGDNGERRPMAGIPCRDAEQPIKRLIDAGHKVAICEQIGKVAPEAFNRRPETPPTVHHEPKTDTARTCRQCAEPLAKKDAERCRECGAILCASHAYSYVDGNNGAITRNSPTLCATCYERKHGPEIKPDRSAADLTIEPFDTERARRAHAHISFTPERRAETERREFYRHASDVLARAQDMAQTDEQRAIMHREYAAWYRGYQSRLYAYLDAKSRTMSPMIAGPANFPTRRNHKRMATEDRRHDELREWDQMAQKRLYAAIERARTPEQVTADRFARLKTEIDRAMSTAAAIDAGTMPGFNRQAFSSSIAGMLRRLAANGEEETVRTALAYIREHQTAMPRPFFTDRNTVWRLV